MQINGKLKIMIATEGPKIAPGEAVMYIEGNVQRSEQQIAELYKLITQFLAQTAGKIEVQIHE